MLEILSHSSHFLPFLSPKRRREIGKTQPSLAGRTHFQEVDSMSVSDISGITDIIVVVTGLALRVRSCPKLNRFSDEGCR